MLLYSNQVFEELIISDNNIVIPTQSLDEMCEGHVK